LRTDVVILGVDGQTEFLVCFDGAAAMILRGVRLDFACQTASAPSMFAQINEHPGAFLLDAAESHLELLAAVTAG
jgi:hypothetical protein